MVTKFMARVVPVLFGAGASLQTGQSVKQLGVTKVLVFHGKGMKKAGIADKIIDSLETAGIEVVAYGGSLPDTPDTIVNEAAELARNEKVDGIVAVGGGSSLDAAKAVNILINNDPPITRYLHARLPQKPGVPLILIPTTSGTGSEVTSVAVVTDTSSNLKIGAVGPATTAKLAIVDPELTLGLSRKSTAITGMDAFSHAVEAYTSAKRNPMSDVLAEKAIHLILENLPKAVENGDDLEVRTNMIFASTLAGTAFSDSVVHIGHALAHTLGAAYHISHGIGCAVVLPGVVEYVADVVPEKVKGLADMMGVSVREGAAPADIGKAVGDAIRSFSRKLAIPGLKELDVDEGTLTDLVSIVLSDTCAANAPKEPSEAEVLDLLKTAYQYQR